MRYRDGRRSLCLSSQSGCPLTCTFCATGQMRFAAQPQRRRDPRPGAALPPPGAGRPRRVHGHGRADDEPRRGARGAARGCPTSGSRSRRTAISTVGWIPGIERLTDLRSRRSASRSRSTPPRTRCAAQLMPVNERYPLADVLDACRADHAARRRTVFVEYVMLAGVNDRYEQAVALARLLEPREAFKVNLIPYNPTDSPYAGSGREAIAAFRAALEARGVRVTVRLTRGREIAAACGQLAAVRGRRREPVADHRAARCRSRCAPRPSSASGRSAGRAPAVRRRDAARLPDRRRERLCRRGRAPAARRRRRSLEVRARDGARAGERDAGIELAAVARQIARVLSLDHDGEAFLEVGERDPGDRRAAAAPPRSAARALLTRRMRPRPGRCISARRQPAQAAKPAPRARRDPRQSFELAGEQIAAFPQPERLLGAIALPGLREQKIVALRGIAQAALDGALDVGALHRLGRAGVVEHAAGCAASARSTPRLIVLRGERLRRRAAARGRASVCTRHAARFYQLARPPASPSSRRSPKRWRPFRTWATVLLRLAGDREFGLGPLSARVGGAWPTRAAIPAPRLAGREQALAQLALLLGRRVPLRHVGQLAARLQAEQLQEQRRRAVQRRRRTASGRSPRSARGRAASRPASRR